MKTTVLYIPALLAASLGACGLTADQAQSDWRDAIAANPTTEPGCFHASYPSMSWEPVACTTAPSRAFASPAPSIVAGAPFTVGNGSDYALDTTSLISQSVGTFPHVSGLVSEKDDGSANAYTLQLNSNFMADTAACADGGSGCLSWAQFVYFSSEAGAAVFMQNWLIGFGSACPTTTIAGLGWNSFGGTDCFINSAAVSATAVPLTADSDLSTLKISGTAVNNGNDTMVFASGTDAFTTNEPDNVTNLASAWNASEFNILGDGGGTEAVFNKSTSIDVRIGVKDGSTAAPTCAVNAGTTGETNNRILGACTALGGAEPSIEFKETGPASGSGSAGSGDAVAHVQQFVAHANDTGAATDTFSSAAAAAGDAVVFQVFCASATAATTPTVTAPGWTITQLTPVVSQEGQAGVAFGAIAPDSAPATFTVTFGASCSAISEIGDEFTGNDPTGGATTFDAVVSGTGGSGLCAAPLTTNGADDAVWSACTAASITGVAAGFTPGAQLGATSATEFAFPDAPASTTADTGFTSTGAWVITGVSIKAQ
jgi:hypothetical protein